MQQTIGLFILAGGTLFVSAPYRQRQMVPAGTLLFETLFLFEQKFGSKTLVHVFSAGTGLYKALSLCHCIKGKIDVPYKLDPVSHMLE